jgi:hypothetical protein
MRECSRGYSLFELIILVVVLSIVCYFIFMSQETLWGPSPDEPESATVERVRLAIHNYGAESRTLDRVPVFPLELDQAGEGEVASEETPLFTSILKDGIRSKWKKVHKNQYVFLPGAGKTTNPAIIYYYDPVLGSFEKGRAPSNQSRAI